MRYQTRDYPTRLNAFRVREGIDLRRWEAESDASEAEMLAWRKGGNIETDKLARLVRAARRITGRPVRASDLVDLGEESPIPTLPRVISGRPRPCGRTGKRTALEQTRCSVRSDSRRSISARCQG
jgi:hypothetical protein